MLFFESLLAHLAGDYLIQSDWMATEKVKRWWPAVVHRRRGSMGPWSALRLILMPVRLLAFSGLPRASVGCRATV
ncbi:DUF3307 domain-containing protein [Streptomyces sp. ISL-1]|uniref:DUF3307 domain-containing protein n=1 Tax=Streptomyces sp. ISL-1 TaxID=2817657 RepID=UPI001BE589FB|nr:DUF3307 domain-containing protein [Streptomyces sp. ISL-1]MBT2390812.1 DUF3307 domain-containing protein [Streptomyces sp. ISL-1]